MKGWKKSDLAQDCYDRVTAWRKVHPKASWREVFENVPNHYAHPVSLYGAMRQVEVEHARRDFIRHLTKGLIRSEERN